MFDVVLGLLAIAGLVIFAVLGARFIDRDDAEVSLQVTDEDDRGWVPSAADQRFLENAR